LSYKSEIIIGDAIGGRSKTQLGDQTATCRAAIKIEAGGPGLRIHVKDEKAGPYRALFKPNSQPPEINVMRVPGDAEILWWSN
jgi:hypothetical protein